MELSFNRTFSLNNETSCWFNYLNISSWFVHTKMRNELEQAGTTWNELKPPGTRWNHLERDELSNELKQKQEIHRIKLCLQYHCSVEHNISENFVTRSTISDVFRFNHLNGMELITRWHTKKTLIGKFVCNIISLQDITLQIPIIDAGKVFQIWLWFMMDNSFSTFAKFSEKLSYVTPWCVRT